MKYLEKVFITGGTGYIGSNLARELVLQNIDVTLLVRENSSMDYILDIKDKVNLFLYDNDVLGVIKNFCENDYDAVFHLASLFLTEHKSNEIDNLLFSNINLGTHILEAMKISNTDIFINTGTMWQNYNSDNYNPVNLYAATKESFEKIIKYYTETSNLKAITLKLFDTFGPNDNRRKILNILREVAEKDIEIDMTAGEQEMDLVYIDDLVDAYIKAYELAATKDMRHEVFAVSSGQVITLKKLVSQFEYALGKKLKINFGGRDYKNREVMKVCKHFKQLPNWKYKTDNKSKLL